MKVFEKYRSIDFFTGCLLLGAVLRIFLATLGNNFDLESYWIVSEAVLQGQSVYAEVTRYNYGPIWFLMLGAFRRILQVIHRDDIGHLHIIVAAFLTLVDLLLARMLRVKFGVKAALFFYLNPVSILITGYHSQFDNFAILIAVVACCWFGSLKDKSAAALLGGAVVLGLSLTIKHVCLFFPFWLWWAARNLSAPKRWLVFGVSYGVFIVSFFPFALDPDSRSGILANVVSYSSPYEVGLISRLLALAGDIFSIEKASLLWIGKFGFVALSFLSAIMWSRRGRKESAAIDGLFIYLISLVAFSPAAADQYLAIALIGCTPYYRFKASWVFSIGATFILCTATQNISAGTLMKP